MTRLKQSAYRKFGNLIILLICLFVSISPARAHSKTLPKKIKITEQEFQYKLGDKSVKIVVSKTAKRLSKFVYFNMHDNENTAVDAAKEILEKYGGTLIELRNDDKRLIDFTLNEEKFTADPNRIFTVTGIVKTLDDNGAYTLEAEKEVDKFAAKLKAFLKNFRLIIAVHNNTENEFSIESYNKGGKFGKDAKIVNLNSEIDTDDFFFVTEKKSWDFLVRKNQNVALQDNENVTDDGSLSVYCGKNRISFLNVESQHGHLKEQIKMLESLQKLIKDFSRNQTHKRRR